MIDLERPGIVVRLRVLGGIEGWFGPRRGRVYYSFIAIGMSVYFFFFFVHRRAAICPFSFGMFYMFSCGMGLTYRDAQSHCLRVKDMVCA